MDLFFWIGVISIPLILTGTYLWVKHKEAVLRGVGRPIFWRDLVLGRRYFVGDVSSNQLETMPQIRLYSEQEASFWVRLPNPKEFPRYEHMIILCYPDRVWVQREDHEWLAFYRGDASQPFLRVSQALVIMEELKFPTSPIEAN